MQLFALTGISFGTKVLDGIPFGFELRQMVLDTAQLRRPVAFDALPSPSSTDVYELPEVPPHLSGGGAWLEASCYY